MPLLSVSHRKQRQQADCLAACAAMVLDYLQIHIGYGRLLRLLQIKAIGTSFRNLRRLGTLGLSVQVEEGTIEQLQRNLTNGLPAVVFVNTGQLTSYWQKQTNHAVVVVGIEGGLVYLNDPEFTSGPQIVPLDEFVLAWEDKDHLYAIIGLQAN